MLVVSVILECLVKVMDGFECWWDVLLVLGFAFLSAEEFGVPRDVLFFEMMDANEYSFQSLRSLTV